MVEGRSLPVTRSNTGEEEALQRIWRGVFVLGGILLLGGVGPQGAAAQGLPAEKYLPTGLALELASASLEACQKQGYRVSVAIVDRAGILRVLLRGDGAGPHSVDGARRKAYTSNTMRAGTAAVDERLRNTPASAGVRNIDQLLPLAGGLPINVGNDTVAAIGVAGAPAGNLDEACAQAGLDKIKDRLN